MKRPMRWPDESLQGWYPFDLCVISRSTACMFQRVGEPVRESQQCSTNGPRLDMVFIAVCTMIQTGLQNML